MIRYISFDELESETIYAEKIECHRQIWNEEQKWTGYCNNPRPMDGISFFCSSIEATYLLKGGCKIIAGSGDMVYIPRHTCYTVSFKNCGGSIDMYTMNFILKDADGNELRLGEKLKVYKNMVSHGCLDEVCELADAHIFSFNWLKKQSIFLRVLSTLSTSLEKQSASYYPIRHGVTLLRKEWDKNEKISRYSNACGISESSFYSYFKTWSGKSPVDYRNDIRIATAKSMITSTNLSILKIAQKTGFEDPYYFSRVFKKSTGLSPMKYRKEHLQF